MENYYHKTGLIFIGLLIFLTAQIQIQGQDKTDHINLNYILSKLTFTSRISKSTEQINEELIKEIQERKVDFVLTSKDEEELIKANANDLLIKTIDKNASDETKENLKQIIYSTLGEHPQNTERRIELGKQYIRVFEDNLDYKVQIEYLKKAIPALEKKTC